MTRTVKSLRDARYLVSALRCEGTLVFSEDDAVRGA